MNLDPIWPFYAGIVVQAIFLLIGQFELKDVTKLLGCCGGSLLGLFPGKREHVYNLPLHLFIVAGVFAVVYAFCFKEKILERINKEILMIWTLIGLYVALQTPLITTQPATLVLILILSAIPVANAFANFDKDYGWKVYFYVWFLCVLIGIAASKFAFSTIESIFGFFHSTEGIPSLPSFFVGMSFLYLAVNLWYVIELIPLPGKHQSFSDRLDQVREDMEILANDYDAEQVRWWKTVLLLVIAVSFLAINYFRHFVSDEMLIPILIGALPVVDKFKLPSKVPVETVADTDSPIKARSDTEE